MHARSKLTPERLARRKEFLTMHFEKKMTYAEIAKANGISVPRVRHLINEARHLKNKGVI